MELALSKSQFVKGLQCRLALWYYKNRPELKRDPDEVRQFMFDCGYDAEALAKSTFPGGVPIEEDHTRIKEAAESTRKAISDGAEILFEATAITPDGNFSRIDVLKKSGENTWDMIEIKSSSQVHDYQRNDAAFQLYVFEEAGFTIRKVFLMHLDPDYKRKGDIQPDALFTKVDLTNDCRAARKTILKRIADFMEIASRKEEPVVMIGSHCKKPWTCDYYDHCWAKVPPYSVFNLLGRSRKKLKEYLKKGILDPLDIKDTLDLSPLKFIELDAHRKGEDYCNPSRVSQFLSEVHYPVYYLDYETITPVIPLYDGTRPYETIPFQFSLHIVKSEDAEPGHIEFIHEDVTDPRPGFVKALVNNLGTVGTVLVYNISFESGVNRYLAKRFPAFRQQLHAINDRMVDLIIPFRSRALYSPKMEGSASLKKVLPAFVPSLSYSDLEIGEGGTASIRYHKTVSNNESEDMRRTTYDNLKKYCHLDTLAMVELHRVLIEKAREN